MGKKIVNRRRGASVVLLSAAAVVVIATLAGTVGAAPTTRRLAGTWNLTVVDPTPGCTEGCIQFTFRGAINGSGDGVTTAGPFPATPPSYLSGGGTVTVHTRQGDVLLEGTTIFNPAPPGEFSFLFKIVGGTGRFAGASGWIGSVGTADIPGVQLTNEIYQGELTLA